MADTPTPPPEKNLTENAAEFGKQFGRDTLDTVRGLLNGATLGGWNVYAGIVNKSAAATINYVAGIFGKKGVDEQSLSEHIALEQNRSEGSLAYKVSEFAGSVTAGIGAGAKIANISAKEIPHALKNITNAFGNHTTENAAVIATRDAGLDGVTLIGTGTIAKSAAIVVEAATSVSSQATPQAKPHTPKTPSR